MVQYDDPRFSLNMEIIDELKFALGDGLPDLFDLFLKDAPIRVENIKEHIANNDYTEIRTCGHTLNGGCATFGATRLSEICAELSEACKQGEDQTALNQILAEMEHELENVIYSINIILQDTSTSI